MPSAKLEMAEYLSPNNKLTNRTIKIPNDFSSKDKKILCIYGEEENLSHIYTCVILNESEMEEISYGKIYKEQRKILIKIESNLKTRENIYNETDVKMK